MKVQGVEKISPGSNWIEMDSKIHLFATFDKSHPYVAEIYVVLRELDRKHNDGPTSAEREEWHVFTYF
ncbi:hypothetical protein ACSBR2_038611 [Camellia fascicularis]